MCIRKKIIHETVDTGTDIGLGCNSVDTIGVSKRIAVEIGKKTMLELLYARIET